MTRRPRRFLGGGSTPLGYATWPPRRSASRHRVRGLPPAKASPASTPSGAKRRAAAAMSSPRPSTAAAAPSAPPGGAVNDHGLALANIERIVHTLERRHPGRGRRPGVEEVEGPGDGRHFVGANGDVFGIEAALRVREAVGPNPIADLEAPDARSDG